MAINYTISYSFSPSTTISSSQVNTNFTDNSSVWQGLEAVTKSFARLQVDAAPTVAADVVRKDYVDHLVNYRRPVLVYNSATVVNIETGLDGTSGDCTILFPDGNLRTDTVTGRIQCNLAQVAALTGSWQSGLRTGAVVNNTWYAIYAVKTSDNSSHWVAVADTVLPLVANFATLNSNFGSNSWIYLGLIRRGDGDAGATVILQFTMAGNFTIFSHPTSIAARGFVLASSAGATSVTYTYVAGTAGAQLPNNISLAYYAVNLAAGSGATSMYDSGATDLMFEVPGSTATTLCCLMAASDGVRTTNGSSVAVQITLAGFVDGVLGVGSNPIL